MHGNMVIILFIMILQYTYIILIPIYDINLLYAVVIIGGTVHTYLYYRYIWVCGDRMTFWVVCECVVII